MRFIGETSDIRYFSVSGHEYRSRVPDVLEQKLEQRHAGHGAPANDDIPAT
jgi:hypothetical protein